MGMQSSHIDTKCSWISIFRGVEFHKNVDMHDMIKCPITSNMGTTHFYIEMTCYHLGTFEDFRDFLLIFFVLLYEGFNTIVALLYQSVKKKFTNTTRGPMFPS
jgi:hypothetical protein